jgi:hypothetical protein
MAGNARVAMSRSASSCWTTTSVSAEDLSGAHTGCRAKESGGVVTSYAGHGRALRSFRGSFRRSCSTSGGRLRAAAWPGQPTDLSTGGWPTSTRRIKSRP